MLSGNRFCCKTFVVQLSGYVQWIGFLSLVHGSRSYVGICFEGLVSRHERMAFSTACGFC